MKVKNCPFCGRLGEIRTEERETGTPGLIAFFTTIRCSGKSSDDMGNPGCNARVTSAGGEEYTLKMWNRRAIEAGLAPEGVEE